MSPTLSKQTAGWQQWRKGIAAVVTGAILGGAIVAAVVLRAAKFEADTPEACIDRMYEAMQQGDVDAYLACYTGKLRKQLDNTVLEQGKEQFAEYLRRTAAPMKGRAILHHKTEWSGKNKVRIVVDRVYEDRLWEYQAYRLKKEPDGWRIYAVEPAEPHEPPVPWGTPAIPLPPEQESEAAKKQQQEQS